MKPGGRALLRFFFLLLVTLLEWVGVHSIGPLNPSGMITALGAEAQPAGPGNTPEAKCLDKKVSFDFVQVGLEEAAKTLQEKGGIKIAIDSGIKKERAGTFVTLKMEEAKLSAALDGLCKLYGLIYLLQDDVVFLTTPEKITAKAIKARLEHEWVVHCLAFSRDGKTLVSAGMGPEILVWDVVSGKQSLKLEGHVGPVKSLALFPDGRSLASGGEDKTIRIWDMSTGKQLAKAEGHDGPINTVAIPPNGGFVASGSADGTIRYWTTTGKELAKIANCSAKDIEFASKWKTALRGSAVDSLAFHPSGRFLASDGGGGVRLWDAATGERQQELFNTWPGGGSLAFSCDGNLLLWFNALWDLAAQDFVQVFDELQAQTVALAPDGKMIAACGSRLGGICLVDTRSGEMSYCPRLDVSVASMVVFSPDSKLLASASGRTVIIWGLAGLERWRQVSRREQEAVTEGREAAQAKLWRENRAIMGPKVSAVAYSPDGKTLAAGGAGVRLYDTSSGKETLKLALGGLAMAFSPDGKRLASGGGCDGTIRVWSVATGQKLLKCGGHSGGVNAIAWSPNGNVIASGGNDGTVRLWSAAGGKELPKLEYPPEELDKLRRQGILGDRVHLSVNCVAFHPGGRFLVSAGGSVIRLWSLDTGKHVRKYEQDPPDLVQTRFLSFSPDGGPLLSLSWGGQIHLWDTASGKHLKLLTAPGGGLGPFGGPTHLACSPDGKTVAGANQNGDVYLWDLKSAEALSVLTGYKPDSWPAFCDGGPLAFSPDGVLLALGSQAGIIILDPAKLTKPPVHSGKSPNDDVLAKLADKKINVEFVQEPFLKAIAFLEEAGGVKMIVDPEIRDTLTGTISIKMNNSAVSTVLEWVLKQYQERDGISRGLAYEIRDGQVFITRPERLKRTNSPGAR